MTIERAHVPHARTGPALGVLLQVDDLNSVLIRGEHLRLYYARLVTRHWRDERTREQLKQVLGMRPLSPEGLFASLARCPAATVQCPRAPSSGVLSQRTFTPALSLVITCTVRQHVPHSV